MIDTILFDWSGTLANSGIREQFLFDSRPEVKLSVLKPGALQALYTLKRLGFQLGIVSNTMHQRAPMMHSLRMLGLDRLFNCVILSSDKNQCEKPCSKIFSDAAQCMRRHPRQCLFVGNKLNQDVFGSQQAGMSSLLLESRFTFNQLVSYIIHYCIHVS
jgi:FMN phosphatase YigB (HAD superfamily)